jgi:hypothetical protein
MTGFICGWVCAAESAIALSNASGAGLPALPQGHGGLRRAGVDQSCPASERSLPPSPVSALGLATSNQVRGVLLRSAAPGGSRGLGVRSGDRNLAEIDRSDAVWRGGWCRTLYPPSGGRERTPVARDCGVRVGVDPVAGETGHGETRSFLPPDVGGFRVRCRALRGSGAPTREDVLGLWAPPQNSFWRSALAREFPGTGGAHG